MLKINKEQMMAWELDRKKDAAYRLARILQSEFQLAKTTWVFENFLGVAENAIEKGSGYGVNTDNHLYRLSKLMIEFGYNFDLSVEEAYEILSSDEESWIKMNRLDAWAHPEQLGDVSE